MAAEQHVETEENQKKGIKRKREPSVLDNLTKLTDVKEKIRVKSALGLLKHLAENEEKADDELKYALGRLVRGLGSSNINAKTGFFTALVGLLNLKNISVDDVFEHVSKELHKGGSNSKSENADICSGQILVSGAILRSNLYQNSGDEDKSKVIQLLLNAGKERTYLSLASYKFLVDLFEKIDSKEFEKIVFPLVKTELSKPWQEQNLDSLYLLMEIQKNFPQSLHKKFLRNNLGTEEILCVENLRHVCIILMTIPRFAALKHPVFDLFIKNLSESDLIEQFFEQLDYTLARSNRNKYFVATKLLSGILENLNDPTIIPDILGKTYIQQTISMYKASVGKQKDMEFENITQKLFEALLTSLKKDCVKTKTKIKVLKKLLFFPGIFVFEKITRSKLIQNITQTLNSEGVKKLGNIYRDVVLAKNDRVINENVTEKWWNSDRIYASHLLVKLINHGSMHEENEWKIEQLILLGKLGLVRNEQIGQELADSFKETFYSALDLKLSKLDDLRLILSQILHEFDQISSENEPELRSPLDKENYETWKQTVEIATKLSGKSKKKNAAFHVLFLHLGLQLLNDTKLASDSLTELFSCYAKTKKPKEEREGCDEPLWIEVVVDLFLNLLSHNSHLLRSIIGCVFPRLCKYLNATAIHQILSVLDPKNESNPLSKPDEESEDEDEDDDENKENGDEDENDDENEENEDSSEDEDDDEEEDNVDDKFRMALHQALGGAGSDAESVDLDNLDDEEGEKLNETLGQAFKKFKPNLGRNKKQKKDEGALTHFRIRVLDLIEIYLNSSPSMLLTLEIMLPLLQLLEFCIKDDHQKPLEHRVNACLKKLTSLKKFSECEDVNEEILADLLKSLLEKGSGNSIVIQEMNQKIADCCIFVIVCSQVLRTEKETKKKKNPINLIIKDSLEAFFTRRACTILYVLFKNLLKLNWNEVLTLLPLLTGFVFAPSVPIFRRTQALELLKIFFHNQRLISTHVEEIEENIINFLRDCVDFFRELSSERKVNNRYKCNLSEVINIIKRSVLGKNFEGWAILDKAMRGNHSNGLSQCVIEVKEAKEKKQKKKKNLNKEELKLKKQSKELRLQSLSEGLNNKRKFVLEDQESKKMKVS